MAKNEEYLDKIRELKESKKSGTVSLNGLNRKQRRALKKRAEQEKKQLAKLNAEKQKSANRINRLLALNARLDQINKEIDERNKNAEIEKGS